MRRAVQRRASIAHTPTWQMMLTTDWDCSHPSALRPSTLCAPPHLAMNHRGGQNCKSTQTRDMSTPSKAMVGCYICLEGFPQILLLHIQSSWARHLINLSRQFRSGPSSVHVSSQSHPFNHLLHIMNWNILMIFPMQWHKQSRHWTTYLWWRGVMENHYL